MIIYVGLAFGFAALLIEVRLPLKYYWELPQFLLRRLLVNFKILRERPVWGYCLDSQTKRLVPLAAIELIDPTTKEVEKITFSNRLGQYGFRIKPGNFIIRAIKNHYVAPPFYDPENIRITSTDESFAAQVTVTEDSWPNKDLLVQSVQSYENEKPINRFFHYFKTFGLGLANGLLIISVLGSLFSWILTTELLYGILLFVSVAFLLIKVYILEAVGSASQDLYA